MHGLRPQSGILLLSLLQPLLWCRAQSTGSDEQTGKRAYYDNYEEFFKLGEEEYQTRVIDNCFFMGHTYQPYLALNTTSLNCYTEANYELCQQGCTAVPECSYFTYWNESQRCCLSGADSLYVAEHGALTGPRVCQEALPGCTDLPGDGFPGPTANVSELAWPSHRVPQKLECWPKNWTRGAFEPCASVSVIEDSRRGFPAKCTGLTRIPFVPQFETCETLCKKSTFCALFQIVQMDGPYGPKSCWHAYATSGINCYVNPEQNFFPIRAKRFQQGEVRVLASLGKRTVQGLLNVFAPYWFINVSDAAHACKLNCHSNIMCQYWQYNQLTGCWVEDPVAKGPVQYPPTSATWDASDPAARTMLAGEYIQHSCSQEKAAGTVGVSDEPDGPRHEDAMHQPLPRPQPAPAPAPAHAAFHDGHFHPIAQSGTPRRMTGGLPWYCWACLFLMVIACMAAGLWGYYSSQEDDEEHIRTAFMAEDAYSSGPDSASHSHLAEGRFVKAVESNYGLVKDPPASLSGKGAGKGGPGHEGALSHAAHQVEAVAQQAAHGISEATHTAVVRAEGALHKAEAAIAGHLPGHSHGHAQPQPHGLTWAGQDPRMIAAGAPQQMMGPTRDQLLQYAHQQRY